MIDAHGPTAAFGLIAKRDVDISKDAPVDSGLRSYALGRGKGAFLRMQHRDELAVFRDLHVRAYGLVVRSAQLRNIIEANFVAAGIDDLANIHPHIFLSLIAGYDGHAGHERGDAEVRQVHPVESARRRLDASR